MNAHLTIIHPTARIRPSEGFPEAWREAERRWYAAAEHPEEIEYVLVVHTSRWSEVWAEPPRFSPWLRTVLICNRGRDCCVDQCNAAGAAVIGDLLIVSMDDLFAPEGWDTLLLQAVPDLRADAVVHCSSGSPDDYRLFIPQIMTRTRYRRLGYIGYPGYESMFVDREFTDHARQDGAVVEAMHIEFEHRHPRFGHPTDAVYAQENRREAYSSGRALYEQRKADRFPPGR